MPCRVVTAAVLTLAFMCSRAGAAFEHTGTSPRDLALGKAALAVVDDVWVPFANPGGLATCRSFHAVFSHTPGLFGLAELSCSGAGISFPFQGMGFALSGSWFGSKQYRENSIAVGVGKTVYTGLGIGMQVHMNRLSIQGYGSTAVLTLDLGIVVECSEVLTVGGIATNITAASLGEAGEALPQALDVGVWYSPIAEVHLGIAVGKEMLFSPELRCGVEVDAAECLTFRAGFTEAPSVVSAGCAFRFAEFSVEYGFAHHWVLGATHEIGIVVQFP
jgi:hypothetical protein